MFKEFGRYEFVTIIEVLNMRKCSRKANKLRYTVIYTIRGPPGDIANKERKINNIKIKNHPFYHTFFVETVSLLID